MSTPAATSSTKGVVENNGMVSGGLPFDVLFELLAFLPHSTSTLMSLVSKPIKAVFKRLVLRIGPSEFISRASSALLSTPPGHFFAPTDNTRSKPILDLSQCFLLDDAIANKIGTSFSHIHTLDLSFCHSLKHLQLGYFHNVSRLSVDSCLALQTITQHGRMEYLNLSNTPRLANFAELFGTCHRTLRALIMRNCKYDVLSVRMARGYLEGRASDYTALRQLDLAGGHFHTLYLSKQLDYLCYINLEGCKRLKCIGGNIIGKSKQLWVIPRFPQVTTHRRSAQDVRLALRGSSLEAALKDPARIRVEEYRPNSIRQKLDVAIEFNSIPKPNRPDPTALLQEVHSRIYYRKWASFSDIDLTDPTELVRQFLPSSPNKGHFALHLWLRVVKDTLTVDELMPLVTLMIAANATMATTPTTAVRKSERRATAIKIWSHLVWEMKNRFGVINQEIVDRVRPLLVARLGLEVEKVTALEAKPATWRGWRQR